ncbi:hypothetical protein [Bacteriovorax sp. Seq25_V]|uniref:hypothetical protein n=1 Tax=Bacteriovorax sp. Seq25_V TaxID=1201288 RepID=UPI000389F17B|nr:hypothetical protein [Bacteriovorax sp. Seq25_V]EQC46052.1 hypothetical protein M900_1777 [Bacteriovorax sp. Seq25_V]
MKLSNEVIAKAIEIIEDILVQEALSEKQIINAQTEVLSLFNVDTVENITNEELQLEDSSEFYLGDIHHHALNNSIFDFYKILKNLEGESTICDIGSAASLLSITANLFFPKIKVISVEPIASRMKAAISLNENLSSHHEFYETIFDERYKKLYYDYALLYFPTGKSLENILKSIMTDSSRGIIAIESHGDLLTRLDQVGKLNNKKIFIKMVSPRHHPYAYIYEVNTKEEDSSSDLILNRIYSSEYIALKIDDSSGSWIGLTEGIEIYFKESKNNLITLKYPPRSISFDENFQFLREEDISSETKGILKLMKDKNSKIRKVYPDLKKVELANGMLLCFDDLGKNLIG